MEKYIIECLAEAKKSIKTDDVPVGAIIVCGGKIIGKGHNTREKKKMVTRHAEINALEMASKKKKDWYLNDCEMYVTLEPCPMCLSAIAQARIKKIYYFTSRNNEVVKEPEKIKVNDNGISQKILKDFFKAKRAKKS